ncbi:MAG: hypothetical protein AAB701_03105 [Patescibacteria group bacterium]
MQQLTRIIASAHAASVSILLTVALTIGSELSPALKTWLTGLTGHHWTSKSIISVVVYGIVFAALQSMMGERSAITAKQSIQILVRVTCLSLVLVIGFFVGEYFHWF